MVKKSSKLEINQDYVTRDPFPNSQKIYVKGELHKDVNVAMREIIVDEDGKSPHSYPTYDTSGAYTDPDISIDIKKGLPKIREKWVLDRNDVSYASEFSSTYTNMQRGKNELIPLTFLNRKPLVAKDKNNVTQMHYAKKGIITPEMEYVSIRENQKIHELLDNKDIDRVNYFAEKHKVKIGYHTHSNNLGSNKITTDQAWDYALSSSKRNYINLDIGHYINVRGNTKESLIEFIKNNHKKICSLHLKDRQFGKYANPGVSDNQIWGFGETPIDKVLRLMRDNSYKFTATIELEYRIPEGSNRVKEVKRCLDYCTKALSS